MNLQIKQLYDQLFLPCYIVLLLFVVKGIELLFHVSFVDFGIVPRSIKGLEGIFFSPLIHADIFHLLSNALPMLILGCALFYFYAPLAIRTYFLLWFLSGLGTWLFGRESYHIGASGLVYGLALFLFVSGILRQYVPLIGLSLIVAFLYGGIIWGMLPYNSTVSWEGHSFGAIAGFLLALYYKNQGPQRKLYDWEQPNYVEPEDELEQNELVNEGESTSDAAEKRNPEEIL